MASAVEAQELSKRFILYHNRSSSLKERFLGLLHKDRRQVAEEFWALRGISLTIDRGESLGLIGRNGSGKSTFLKLIAGIHRPTSGRLLVLRGARIGTMIELGVGFHPELTGQENVFLNAAIHGMSRDEIEAVYDRVVEYSGLEHFMDVPLKNYSSGMHMRLGFAVAANLDPDILLVDEIFAVGDEDFQQRCTRTMQEFRSQGKTIVFVSHLPAAIRSICDRVCLLDHGELRYDGPVDQGFGEYQRLLSPRAPEPASRPAPPDADRQKASERTDDRRRVQDEIAALTLEFLRQQGLTPHHRLLDVGCGPAPDGSPLQAYLTTGHYWRVAGTVEHPRSATEAGRSALESAPEGTAVFFDSFDLSRVPDMFDFALGSSACTRLPLNRLAPCIASVVRKLSPDGRFYVSWFENPDPASLDPIVRPDGVTTYADAEPYHHTFETLARLCETLGAKAERLGPWLHPQGETMMVITRR